MNDTDSMARSYGTGLQNVWRGVEDMTDGFSHTIGHRCHEWDALKEVCLCTEVTSVSLVVTCLY
jgi:hypothetical protein